MVAIRPRRLAASGVGAEIVQAMHLDVFSSTAVDLIGVRMETRRTPLRPLGRHPLARVLRQLSPTAVTNRVLNHLKIRVSTRHSSNRSLSGNPASPTTTAPELTIMIILLPTMTTTRTVSFDL